MNLSAHPRTELFMYSAYAIAQTCKVNLRNTDYNVLDCFVPVVQPDLYSTAVRWRQREERTDCINTR